jgi:hypothetical protein
LDGAQMQFIQFIRDVHQRLNHKVVNKVYACLYIYVYVILYQDLSLEFQCLNDIATYSHPEPLQYPTRTAGNHLGAPTLELLNRPEPAPSLHNDLQPPHNSHWNLPKHTIKYYQGTSGFSL